MTLFIVPCSDSNNRYGDRVIVSQTTDDHDKTDTCSPFCQCACCSISMTSLHVYIPELNVLPSIFIAKKTAIKNVHFISNYFGTIWQPPKI